MVPAAFHMEHYVGDPWGKTFTFSDVDLTDLTPKLILERDDTQTDWSSYLSLDAGTGVVTMAVPASATAALAAGRYEYDLKFVDDSAVTVRTYLTGTITLLRDVNA